MKSQEWRIIKIDANTCLGTTSCIKINNKVALKFCIFRRHLQIELENKYF